MVFFFIAILFMVIGRKIGWALSKNILYSSSEGVAAIISIVWGFAVALSMFILIRWQNPNLPLKIIMGYALGAYVSIPNFGLIAEGTIPERAIPQHRLISNAPFAMYVISSIALAFII